ncbi:aminotransferase class V-fold PLP-dependent enzyme [Arthrobacter sp. B2a2-09]|uniref:aminotransferase class V-fold PLP-dependent enzyme n=1 Tax=Arthrobacter sp. B2a2-09 TaxID=2952822 RepID=UPI0022CD5752|nr:aminotransferase class V-fold PLP-dependent enzyme [Arthrobacter sp. B2a2-09]MCZ9882264.1 aminotransferase class V-fold PLP-dependent enzyme [Arthrobacter sp. B2a2-09]
MFDIQAIRAATPGCENRIHLNNAGAGLLSRETLTTMTGHLELEASIGGYEAAASERERIAQTYANIAELINGRADEIALFDNSTHAWNAAFYSMSFKRGDRILTGRAEYGSNVLAYLQIAQRTGAEIVIVPNDEHGQLDLHAMENLIDNRTKLIGVSHIPTSGGLINPAAAIGQIARKAGVPFLLDATQSVGQIPVDVEALGCDMLTATGRKYLRGPRGIGFLWVRTSALEHLEPFVAEIASATWNGDRGFEWQPGATRFETWEYSYSNILGLSTAVRQTLDIGMEAIGPRCTELGASLRGQLDAIQGVTTYDLGARKGAIVTAKIDNIPTDVAAAMLGKQGINVSTTAPEQTQFDTEDRGVHPLIRLSPHYYNTEDEIAQAVRAVSDLASRAR